MNLEKIAKVQVLTGKIKELEEVIEYIKNEKDELRSFYFNFSVRRFEFSIDLLFAESAKEIKDLSLKHFEERKAEFETELKNLINEKD